VLLPRSRDDDDDDDKDDDDDVIVVFTPLLFWTLPFCLAARTRRLAVLIPVVAEKQVTE